MSAINDVLAAVVTFIPPIAWVVLVLAVAAAVSTALTMRSFGRDGHVPVPPIVIAAEPSEPAEQVCTCGERLAPGSDAWGAHWTEAQRRGEGADRHRIAGAWADLRADQ